MILIEEVSNKPFNEYMKSEIFEPLGMTSSTFLVNEVDKDELSDCLVSQQSILSN